MRLLASGRLLIDRSTGSVCTTCTHPTHSASRHCHRRNAVTTLSHSKHGRNNVTFTALLYPQRCHIHTTVSTPCRQREPILPFRICGCWGGAGGGGFGYSPPSPTIPSRYNHNGYSYEPMLKSAVQKQHEGGGRTGYQNYIMSNASLRLCTCIYKYI